MVTIYYYTNWSPCFIHTSYEGQWKSLKMSPHPFRRGWQQISLTYLGDFVLTNGDGIWDNPQPGRNYQNPGVPLFAVYRGKEIPIEPTEPILLISDLDNTLIGSHPDTHAAQRRFNEYWISKHYFGGSKLVYSTGRCLEEYLELIDEGYKMLEPDMIVTAVGSDAYTKDYKTGQYLNHIDFHHLYDGENWDSEIMAKLVQEHFPWMVIPTKKYIYPFKIWVTARISDVLEHKQRLKQFLKNANGELREGKVIHARAIISGIADWRYIDVTPRIGGKRMGVRYAQKYFKFAPDHTIVAGDSGNDIEMFRDPEHYGILVGNAEGEMCEWFNKKPRENKFKSEFFWGDAIVDGIEKIFANRISKL